jgi:hypothetical protein
MKSLLAQHQVAAIFQAILGNQADTTTLNFFGFQIATGKIKPGQMANNLIATHDGQDRFQGLNNNEKINYIYSNITGGKPDSTTLDALSAQLDQGVSLGDITLSIINQLESYSGNNETILTQQTFLANNIATTLYPALNHPAELGASAADIQAIYYITGGAVVAEGVNFWANYLHNNPDKLAYVAQKFVEERHAVASLNDEDFVRTLFQNTFKQTATTEEVAHYLAGLDNNSETRGDVVAKMLNDIRMDITHPEAKAQFDLSVYVYTAGEMPAVVDQETVAALYFSVARSSVTADGLDTWSKKLASGTSEADLLKILSVSAQFKAASNYGDIYLRLYGERLTTSEAQAILLKAGNNELQATSLIIDAFRKGEYPLDNHSTPLDLSKVINFEREVGLALNYATGAATLEIASSGGNPFSTVNSGKLHQLTNAELSQLTKITLNANVEQGVDLSFNKIRDITLTGDYATSNVVLDSLAKQNKNITLMVDNTNFQHIGPNTSLGENDIKLIFGDDVDIANADMQLLLSSPNNSKVYTLVWDGNGQSGGANQVSTTFTVNASASQSTTLSANFITKDICLTTQQDGSVSAIINSSFSQFTGFGHIDLTHYKGTGSIYLDGELVATEGVNVLDLGIINQTATINNTQYANVNSLAQARIPTGYVPEPNLNISAYSGEIQVLNMKPSTKLFFEGDVTADSKIHLNYNVVNTGVQTFYLSMVPSVSNKQNGGTVDISAKGNYSGLLNIYTEGAKTDKTLALSGADNHIQKIELDGYGSSANSPDTLNLTISHDFSDSLKYIIGTSDVWHRSSFTILNINAEKGGTGGGGFFDTLASLTNGTRFSTITSQLAGDQLSIGNVPGSTSVRSAEVQINHAWVQANTTLENATELNFADSSINSLISLLTVSNKTQIHAGTGDQQWTFSSTGSKTMQVYGSVSTPTEVNTLFNGINMNGVGSASDLFSKVLSKVTQGTSEGQLTEAGLLKLDHTVYVIIDKNHNQSFDDQDIVFALGGKNSEMDVYQTAVSLHYQPPEVSLVAASTAHHEAFA